MGYLLPALTDAKFENQRNVVLNERRQNYENRPYGLAGMSLVSALYPPDHPYHWMTIGAAEDIKAARLDDVREFFQTYYRPRNASLAIAGDIDADRAVALASAYFGDLDPGPETPPVIAASGKPDGRDSPDTRRPHRTAAPLHRMALARALWRGRCRARSGVGSSGRWEDVAALSQPGLRAAHCLGDCRLAGVA